MTNDCGRLRGREAGDAGAQRQAARSRAAVIRAGSTKQRARADGWRCGTSRALPCRAVPCRAAGAVELALHRTDRGRRRAEPVSAAAALRERGARRARTGGRDRARYCRGRGALRRPRGGQAAFRRLKARVPEETGQKQSSSARQPVTSNDKFQKHPFPQRPAMAEKKWQSRDRTHPVPPDVSFNAKHL